MEDTSQVNTIPVNPVFLQTLKSSTAQLHELLESSFLLSAIMSSNVTTRQYSCYLHLMQNIMEAYEENVLPLLSSVVNNLQQSRSSTLIKEDLQYLGNELTVGITPAKFGLANSMTVPYALGFMYVMEGSKLGGKVIFKHIESTLGFSAERGARFITDYGNNTGSNWRKFLTLLSTYINENGCEADVIEGARLGFSSIYEFFESNRLVYDN